MSHDVSQTCVCVREHRPKVMELHRHHILPLYLGGPDIDDNLVWICPNSHIATHEVLREYLRLDARPPWGWLDDYPVMARDLAERAWQMHLAGRATT